MSQLAIITHFDQPIAEMDLNPEHTLLDVAKSIFENIDVDGDTTECNILLKFKTHKSKFPGSMILASPDELTESLSILMPSDYYSPIGQTFKNLKIKDLDDIFKRRQVVENSKTPYQIQKTIEIEIVKILGGLVELVRRHIY